MTKVGVKKSIGGGTCGNCGTPGKRYVTIANGVNWGTCCEAIAPVAAKPRNTKPVNPKNEGRPTITFQPRRGEGEDEGQEPETRRI